MYGRKGRIGLIVLDADLTIEPDLRRLLPEGVEIHTARVIYPRRVTVENLAIAADRAVACVEELLPIRPVAIAWACTSGSFSEGKAGNERLIARLKAAAGDVPVTTASAALAAALGTLGITRPAVGSPYSATINQRLHAFLGEHGIAPVDVRSLYAGEVDDYALQDIEPDHLADFIRGLAAAGGDGVVMSCTGVPTSQLVPRLEPEIGRPILTSNLAIAWHCWKLGGIEPLPTVDCRLFRTLATN
ncbi:maleate cis-trans isomerase family protein [Ancylobacter terrae]|uniref:maleate cis-trans isomerase family protein n=1 Tax=Ancylobacter sp. sgz301288 TaxID=3342077 RepID=UPI00385F439D